MAYDNQFQRATLAINEARLRTAIESLGRCPSSEVREALALIRDFANSICITPPLEQQSKQVELSGDAKAKLNGVVGKVADVGLGIATKYTDQKSRGVLQAELANAIKNGNDCRLSASDKLIERLIPVSPKGGATEISEPPYYAPIIGEYTGTWEDRKGHQAPTTLKISRVNATAFTVTEIRTDLPTRVDEEVDFPPTFDANTAKLVFLQGKTGCAHQIRVTWLSDQKQLTGVAFPQKGKPAKPTCLNPVFETGDDWDYKVGYTRRADAMSPHN